MAVAVFGPPIAKNLGLARLVVGRIISSPDSRWMLAPTTDTTLPEGFLFVAKAADLGKPDVAWKQIAGYADKITDLELARNDLYLMTYINAPRKHVLKLDLREPRLALAKVVAVPPPDSVLEGFSLNRDALVASIRQGTSIGIRHYASGDTQGQTIEVPFAGAAGVHGDPAHAYKNILYSLSGWTQLPRTFLFDGYGAYGFSETAHFSPASMVWLERGGVLAFANVRGSGVYGNDWYQAGFKATKSNTWKDGVACAQYLIKLGYATPKTLAVMGASAGGIFVGRSVTSALELFAAAVFNVGVMDAIRSEESANGITNISEFGSTRNAAEFPALLEMSTYHNIQDNTP